VALPPVPLPPAERTVGQLVAETIRLYGRRFWPSLALGVLPAVGAVALAATHRPLRFVLALTVWPLVVSLSYAAGCALAAGSRLDRGATARAVLLGALLLVPAGFLASAFILPGVAWLALVGLAVPAAVIERRGVRASLARGFELGRADYVHALGSLAALAIVVGVSELTLIALLRSQGDNGQRVAHGLADLVLSPLLYLGAAQLYGDQAARVGSRRPDKRSRDADLHPPVDADAAGRPDPQVEP
jgi:hypothetical protein